VVRHLVTAEGTRAALPAADLVKLAGPGGDQALDALVAGRLLVARDDVDGDVIELAHERLVEAWPLLRRIREEDAADARLRDDLRAAARGWSQRQRRDDELWRGRALAELERFRGGAGVRLTRLEEEFADASRALGRRTRRRRRAAAAAALVAAIAAAAALALAERAARRSEARARVLAEAARRGEADAQVRLAAMWAAEGRRESARGSALRSLAYLAPAYGAVDGPGLRFALARAMTSIDEERAVLRGHHSPIDRIEWSRDGRFLATSDMEDAVRLWRFGAGRVEPAGQLDEGHGVALGFSPDGALLGVGGEKGVSIRQVPALREVVRVDDGAGPKTELGGDFTGDGRGLLLFRYEGRLSRYGLDGALRERGDAGAKIGAFEASRTGDRVAFTGDEGGLYFADLARGAVRVRRIVPASVPLGLVAIDDRGDLVAAAGTDGNTYLFDGASGARRHVLASHPGRHGVALSRDGRWLATGGADRTAKLWDAASGRLVATLAEHRGPVTEMRFDPVGERLATACGDGAVRIYDTRGVLLAAYEGHAADVIELAWSPDGEWLASGGSDGLAAVWPGRAAQTRELPSGAGELVDVARCGRWLGLAHERELALYDPGAGRLARRVPVPEIVGELACSAEAGRIALGTTEGVRLYRLDGAPVAFLRDHESPVPVVAFSPDGRRMATLGFDGSVRLWSAETGAAIRTLVDKRDEHVHASAIEFTADGAALLVGDSTGAVSVWDLAGGGRLRRARLHQHEILSLDLSPDGARLATASADRSLSIWRAADLTRVRTIDEQASYITSMDWSADGALLVTGSQDSTAFVWEVESGALVGEIRPGQGAVVGALFAGDRIVAGSSGGRVLSFPAGLEQRSPAEIRKILDCRLPYRMSASGHLERVAPGEGCAAAAGVVPRPTRP
jgi:WD40 repeat protein